jgi:CheY-like chemotaxis protein/DNA-directed RNA polymerase specialized sigma24 family protein
MGFADTLAPHLPLLRRYSRALTGSQESGDAFVAATLRALIEDMSSLDPALNPRAGLYRVFHAIWSSANVEARPDGEAITEAKAQARLRALTPINRQALLLSTIEGFSTHEVAAIIGVEADDAATLIASARAEIESQMHSRILIIEDEMLIAVDLSEIVERLGHSVVATVDTAAKAVQAANQERPDLILADIQLADGSSGIDAVKDILASFAVPVVFITAFPDRLLTGERPEPTFLITKPYLERTVQAAVSQALFFESSRQ